VQGRDFLDLAREIIRGGTEKHWRGAAGRAYYALMLECRDALFRWGFALPLRETVHTFARDRFQAPNHRDLRAIGDPLARLGRLRNRADYEFGPLRDFSTAGPAQLSLTEAAAALVVLDGIDNDLARRRQAIAAIRAVFP
jgi:hypothetical protein